MRRKIFVCFLGVIALATGVWAQQQFNPQLSAPLVFKPSYFQRAFFRPMKYTLESPGTLKSHVADGKLTLSLAEVVQLVVQRNTDVWLARLDLQTADTVVMGSYAPFDPSFRSSFNSSRSAAPTSSSLQASTSLTQNASFSYTQAFQSGTSYTVAFTGRKSADNNSYTFMNPSINTGMNINVTQPLLRNRGFYIQRAPIVIAKINQQSSRRTFEQNLNAILQQAINQYWAVVQSRESLAIARTSLANSEKSYARDKRALELGALPPLDIFRSEAEVAGRKVVVTQSVYMLQQQEDALRRMIAADLDPDVRNLSLNLTDSPFPSRLAEINVEEETAKALRYRPDLDKLKRQQAVDDINVRTAMNNLKPDLNLSGNYSSNGLGGNTWDRDTRALLGMGGFTDAMNQLFAFNNPTYGFSLTLNFPIRSRQYAAALASSQITQRRNMYAERQLTQQITLDVKTAASRVEQAKASLDGSKVSRDLEQKNVEAEQKKYELGAETIFFVLDAQARLASAELNYLQSAISYRQALTALQQATGTLLTENNVVLDEAARVSHVADTEQNKPAAQPAPVKQQ